MSYLVDSHCHLHDKSCFPEGAEEILAHARENNVLQIITVGTTHEDSLAARKFASEHEDVFWSYGVHPSEANQSTGKITNTSFRAPDRQPAVAGVGPLVPARKPADPSSDAFADFSSGASVLPMPIAIGEVGLDYHYMPYDREAQIRLLEEMIELAQTHDLPLIFHVREAFEDFFPIVDNAGVKNAVVHSFSDSRENLERALERGYYIGVNGLATFADIPLPPLERMLLETDAPYLTPVPFRGKINMSGYISNIAEYLADKMGVSREEIAEKTTQNVQRLFHIPGSVVRAA